MTTSRCYLPISISLLCFIIFTQSGWSQGFLTRIQHNALAEANRIEFLADSTYLIKGPGAVIDPANQTLFPTFNTLHLNKNGVEIGWDSVVLSTNEFGKGISGYFWLPDDQIIRARVGDTTNWNIQAYDLTGDSLWNYTLLPGMQDQVVVKVAQNAAGEIFVLVKEFEGFIGHDFQDAVIYKFSSQGTLLWSLHSPGSYSFGTAFVLTPTQDGGCLYGMDVKYPLPAPKDVFQLHKASASGALIWSDTLSYATNLNDYVIQENAQGEVFICSSWLPQGQIFYTCKLEKRGTDGQIIWSESISDLFQQPYGLYTYRVVLGTDGDLLLTGVEYVSGADFPAFFARLDPNGNLRWKKHYAFLPDLGNINGIATPDNGFVFAGNLGLGNLFAALKMDANGNVFPGALQGRLAIDDNLNCLIDSSEQALANWKIKLQSADYTLYASTDSSGHYAITDLPGGDYLLTSTMPSSLWESCLGEVTIAIPDTTVISIAQDLPVQVLAECPFMTLDIATAGLRRCFTNNYTVHYCNQGTVVAHAAYVQVVLDPFLNFNTASIPHTQNGDALYFSLPPIASLECGDFTFNVTVDCDSVMLGQTLCVGARIFPDTICNPPSSWSGALLEGSGYCDGDSVRFQLRNVGVAPTSSGLDFIIADDHVIMFNQPLPPLAPNDPHNVAVPANGTTWRMLAEQEPNAPGQEMPSVGVEGCGTGATSPFGFMLQFPNRDGNPFTDRDCHEVVGSFDPNDKQAFPIGIGNQHYIEQNTSLDYQIRFQNTGTDTAFTVVVKDVLSPWLDPATMRPGASSHPYNWALSGTGILTVTFENILLPDSNINEAASHGFVQFSIEQRPDNPLGALLENRAGIYFDFNAPVMTNTVWHTIGHDFLTSATREPKAALPLLHIWPNPASQVTTVWTHQPFRLGQQWVLSDALGHTVQTLSVQGPSVELHRGTLPIGLYFIELREGNRILQRGKIVWQ